MKTIKKICALALAMGLAGAAQAAVDPGELTVGGQIKPPACTIVAPEQGVYDYGKKSSTLIQAGTAVTPLESISKRWSVQCDAITYVTFRVHDAEDGTESIVDVKNFGLGSVNGTGKVGYYNVLMSNSSVDGVTAKAFATNTGDPTQFGATTGAFVRKNGYTMGWRYPDVASLVPGERFEADMTVSAFLAGSADMGGRLTESVALQGSLIMSYAFGL